MTTTESQAPKKIVSRIQGIQRVKMDAIDPFKFGNPRAMDDRMRGVLKNSIDDLGYVIPVVARVVEIGDAKSKKKVKRFEILDGHHRYDDAKARGETDLDILVVDIPDDAKARKLAIAVNRIGADWDMDKLGAYVEAMLADGVATAQDIVDSTGFAADELEQLAKTGTDWLENIEREARDEAAGKDDEPPPTTGTAKAGSAASGDTVKLSMVCTPTEHASIYGAIKLARQRNPDLTAVQALATIAKFYQETAR